MCASPLAILPDALLCSLPPSPPPCPHSLLEAAKNQGKDESWVPSTVTYINMRTEVARLNQEVVERRKDVDKAVAERDAMITAMATHNSQEAVSSRAGAVAASCSSLM
jgi:hypothetical protein